MQHNSLRNWAVFLLPSFIGILLFMTPIQYGDGVTVAVKVLADWFLAQTADVIMPLLLVTVIASAVITLATKLLPNLAKHLPRSMRNLFAPSWFWVAVRVTGALFAVLVYWQIGPQAIHSEVTGGLLFVELLPSLFAVFLFAGLLLPLLLNFGLLEFIGSLMTPIMRPLFRLPGRSAVDCSTSWLGDGSVGILLTTKQYEQGHYTQKEAAIIATSFSLVSISFTLVIIDQVGLSHMIFPMYGAISLANLVAAVIMARIPPLSGKANKLVNEQTVSNERDRLQKGEKALQVGVQRALMRSHAIGNPGKELKEGVRNSIEMIFGLLPVVLAFGTIALILAETTPLFDWLGAPFVPLLELLAIPHAAEIGGTLVVGFADMFLPAILVADVPSEMTRFVIGALSVTQLIYMSEVGALLLGSKLPIRFRDIVAIFILRTLITLPVIAGVAHILF